PRLVGLPDRFTVFAYRGDQLVHSKVSLPVRQDATMLAAPDSTDGQGLFDERSKWVVDFPRAVQDGLGVEVELSDEDLSEGFDRVVVTGVRWSNPVDSSKTFANLLTNHRYTSGAGFIRPGTPTNNTVRDSS